MSVHQAQRIPEWGPTTFFLHDQAEPDAETLQKLAARKVAIERARVLGVEGEATVRLRAGRGTGVFAAGDLARLFSNATLASADGVMAAAGVHFSLVFE